VQYEPLNPTERAVIIVKENHSFDNYFGLFPGVNGTILDGMEDGFDFAQRALGPRK
jgi:phospholipase C